MPTTRDSSRGGWSMFAVHGTSDQCPVKGVTLSVAYMLLHCFPPFRIISIQKFALSTKPTYSIISSLPFACYNGLCFRNDPQGVLRDRKHTRFPNYGMLCKYSHICVRLSGMAVMMPSSIKQLKSWKQTESCIPLSFQPLTNLVSLLWLTQKKRISARNPS